MFELDSTVKKNVAHVIEANHLALNALTVAVRGGDEVARVVHTMQGINASSHTIFETVSMIDGITSPTNILALNAAVESARTGEQGRGFAVVATEVRSLAGRAAVAAKEIKSLISASVARVDQGTELVDRAGQTMKEVLSSIQRATEILSAIYVASQEQNLGVSQVAQAISQKD
jgi:methyl-accepting chemotaxis protein-1 (serine sensor receptor)